MTSVIGIVNILPSSVDTLMEPPARPYKENNGQSTMIYTVEPLVMDTPYKGHNRINLHIKDMFNGPKC